MLVLLGFAVAGFGCVLAGVAVALLLSGNGKLALKVGALGVCGGISGMGLLALAGSGSWGGTAATTPKPAAPAAPIRTPPSVPSRPPRPIHLGSEVDDLVASWGSHVPHASNPPLALGFGRCAGATVRFSVLTRANRAYTIIGQECNGEDLAREVRTFMPTDAKRVGSLETDDGRTVEVYRSASLADRFAAEEFRGCGGKRLPKGTFVKYVGETFWQLSAGGCP